MASQLRTLEKRFIANPRSFSSSSTLIGVTLLPGDGIGPEIAESIKENLANPTALLLSGVTMLRHLNLLDQAEQIQKAILNTIAEGKYRTADLGGTSKTTEFTNAIVDHL